MCGARMPFVPLRLVAIVHGARHTRSRGNSMNRYVPSTAAAVLLLATSAYAQEPPPLRAAVDGTFAPHAFPNLSGGYQGFNVDLANEIAKRLKRKVVIDYGQYSGFLPAGPGRTLQFVAP